MFCNTVKSLCDDVTGLCSDVTCLCAGELSSLLEFTRLETGQPSLSNADDVTAAGAKKKLPFSTSFHDTSSGGWSQRVWSPVSPSASPVCWNQAKMGARHPLSPLVRINALSIGVVYIRVNGANSMLYHPNHACRFER